MGLWPAANPTATVRSSEDSKNHTDQIFALGHPAIVLSNSNGNADAYTSNGQIFDGPILFDDKVTLPGYKCARNSKIQNLDLEVCAITLDASSRVRTLCLDAVGWRTGLSDSHRESLKVLCVVVAALL
jgi:hypothetical protein